MGLAVQSTMTYVVLRCVTNGTCNEWEDTYKTARALTIQINRMSLSCI